MCYVWQKYMLVVFKVKITKKYSSLKYACKMKLIQCSIFNNHFDNLNENLQLLIWKSILKIDY